MGGRGASSGGNKQVGFSWTTANGRNMTVEKTASGQLLVNGEPNNILSYDKLLAGAKKQANYKPITAKESKQKTDQRYNNYKSHDYELIGENARKAARTSRMTTKAQKR